MTETYAEMVARHAEEDAARKAVAARKAARDRKFSRIIGGCFLTALAGIPVLFTGGMAASNGSFLPWSSRVGIAGGAMALGGFVAALMAMVVSMMVEDEEES